ncbi:MAG: hypothetical protein E6J58_18185 [Deltaproteobacteria bacterium]|nr:MAG: hypothetical protein E6J58_18185 [Deltaproteobacteria bacterium]
MRRLNLALAMLSAGIGLASPAFAYRPFDGTDGDVADVGEFELEMGPAHFLSSPEGRYIVAPATVLNLGVARGLELVVDFKDFVGLQSVAGQPRMRLLDTDIFLKGILRRGTLQGESGVSIALEAGPLLPELGGTRGLGAQANLITSYRWEALSLHLNTSAALTRDHQLDGFVWARFTPITNSGTTRHTRRWRERSGRCATASPSTRPSATRRNRATTTWKCALD